MDQAPPIRACAETRDSPAPLVDVLAAAFVPAILRPRETDREDVCILPSKGGVPVAPKDMVSDSTPVIESSSLGDRARLLVIDRVCGPSPSVTVLRVGG